MNVQQATGIFGKLPAHGDFIHRNLSSRVINSWDAWLQAFIGSTQERLGEHWLDVYLTSPIWRFCLSSGVLDDNVWAGILLPSVDRVGRYFPLTVIRKLSVATVPTAFIGEQHAWYEALESAALAALDGQVQVEQLIELTNQAQPAVTHGYRKQRARPVTAGVVIDTDFEQPEPGATLAFFLDAFVAAAFASYSVWATSGSDRVHPCTFITAAMPPTAGGAAMLDGQWEAWEWSVPVFLQAGAEPAPAPMPEE